jgi:hypothetical protein
MAPREVAQEDLVPGKRYYIITNRQYVPQSPDNLGPQVDDQTRHIAETHENIPIIIPQSPVIGIYQAPQGDNENSPIICYKWVGTFTENDIQNIYINSRFDDVVCMGMRWNAAENRFTPYDDNVIHVGSKEFINFNQSRMSSFLPELYYRFYEKFELSEETRVNRMLAEIDPRFSWSMATEPVNTPLSVRDPFYNYSPYFAATATRQRRHPPETTSDNGAATTTGGRRHYSRKNKKKRQKKRRNTKSKKYRK